MTVRRPKALLADIWRPNSPEARQEPPPKIPVSGQRHAPDGHRSRPPRRCRKRDPGPPWRQSPGKQNAAHGLPCAAFSAHRGSGRVSRSRDRAAGRPVLGSGAVLPGTARAGASRGLGPLPPAGCRRTARSSSGPPPPDTGAFPVDALGGRWERGAAPPGDRPLAPVGDQTLSNRSRSIRPPRRGAACCKSRPRGAPGSDPALSLVRCTFLTRRDRH